MATRSTRTKLSPAVVKTLTAYTPTEGLIKYVIKSQYDEVKAELDSLVESTKALLEHSKAQDALLRELVELSNKNVGVAEFSSSCDALAIRVNDFLGEPKGEQVRKKKPSGVKAVLRAKGFTK